MKYYIAYLRVSTDIQGRDPVCTSTRLMDHVYKFATLIIEEF